MDLFPFLSSFSLFSLLSVSNLSLSLSFKPLFPVHFHSILHPSSLLHFDFFPFSDSPLPFPFQFFFFSSTNEVSILSSFLLSINRLFIPTFLFSCLPEGGGGKEWNDDSLSSSIYLSLSPYLFYLKNSSFLSSRDSISNPLNSFLSSFSFFSSIFLFSLSCISYLILTISSRF